MAFNLFFVDDSCRCVCCHLPTNTYRRCWLNDFQQDMSHIHIGSFANFTSAKKTCLKNTLKTQEKQKTSKILFKFFDQIAPFALKV